MKTTIAFALLLLISGKASAQKNSPTIRRWVFLSDHLSALKAYGDHKPFSQSPVAYGGMLCEAAMWKVGDGFLVITHTMGAAIVVDITYVIQGDNSSKTTLRVKEFNPTTGEMTIIVPNQALKQTGRANATIKHFRLTGVFRDSMVFWLAPSGRLALR